MSHANVPPYPILDSPTDDLQFRELYSRVAHLESRVVSIADGEQGEAGAAGAAGDAGAQGSVGERGLPGATGDPGVQGKDGRPQLVRWQVFIDRWIQIGIPEPNDSDPDEWERTRLLLDIPLFEESSPYLHFGLEFYNHVPDHIFLESLGGHGYGWQDNVLWTIYGEHGYDSYSQRFIDEKNGVSFEKPFLFQVEPTEKFEKYVSGVFQSRYVIFDFLHNEDDIFTSYGISPPETLANVSSVPLWSKYRPRVYKPLNPVSSGQCRLRLIYDRKPGFTADEFPHRANSYIRVSLSGSYIRFPRSVLLSAEL